MKELSIVIGISLYLISSVCSYSQAQESNTQFFLDRLPVNTLLNPAFQPAENEFIIGLPLVSGINFNSVSGFPYNTFKITEGGNNLLYNFNSLYNVLQEDNMSRLSIAVPLFFTALKRKDNYYSFSIAQKGTLSFRGSPGLVKFIAEGNAPYWGKNESLGEGSFYTLYFKELGLGISHKSGEKLFFGGRGKILFGKTMYNATGVNFSVSTNEQGKYLSLVPEGGYEVSAPIRVNYVDSLTLTTINTDLGVGDYFYSLHNMGFSADLGLTWLPAKNMKISLGITDAGFIGFKRKTFSFNFFRGIRYPEKNLYQSSDPDSETTWYKSPEKVISAFGDSVSHIIIPGKLNRRSVKAIPLRVFTGTELNLSPEFSVGFLARLFYLDRFSSVSIAPMLMASPIRNLEGAISYTLDNHAGNSIGFAIHYAPENFNLYFISDNIQGVLHPSGTKTINLCFGFLLKFSS